MELGSFPENEIVKKGRNKLRYESDSIYRFWIDRTEETEDSTPTTMAALYLDYQSFCNSTGLARSQAGRNTFIRNSREFGMEQVIPGLSIYTQDDPGYGQSVCIGRKHKAKPMKAVVSQ
jgi:phage/plasmid-associated DNA primase